MTVWHVRCRMIGHDLSWPLARAWGYSHAPMCRRCHHIPKEEHHA
jgi:hypothetical protein